MNGNIPWGDDADESLRDIIDPSAGGEETERKGETASFAPHPSSEMFVGIAEGGEGPIELNEANFDIVAAAEIGIDSGDDGILMANEEIGGAAQAIAADGFIGIGVMALGAALSCNEAIELGGVRRGRGA